MLVKAPVRLLVVICDMYSIHFAKETSREEKLCRILVLLYRVKSELGFFISADYCKESFRGRPDLALCVSGIELFLDFEWETSEAPRGLLHGVEVTDSDGFASETCRGCAAHAAKYSLTTHV